MISAALAFVAALMMGIVIVLYRSLREQIGLKESYKQAHADCQRLLDVRTDKLWRAEQQAKRYKMLYEELAVDDQDEKYIQESLGLAEKPDL